MNTQFCADIPSMCCNGMNGNTQFIGNLFVHFPLRKAANNLLLSFAQSRQ